MTDHADTHTIEWKQIKQRPSEYDTLITVEHNGKPVSVSVRWPDGDAAVGLAVANKIANQADYIEQLALARDIVIRERDLARAEYKRAASDLAAFANGMTREQKEALHEILGPLGCEDIYDTARRVVRERDESRRERDAFDEEARAFVTELDGVASALGVDRDLDMAEAAAVTAAELTALRAEVEAAREACGATLLAEYGGHLHAAIASLHGTVAFHRRAYDERDEAHEILWSEERRGSLVEIARKVLDELAAMKSDLAAVKRECDEAREEAALWQRRFAKNTAGAIAASIDRDEVRGELDAAVRERDKARAEVQRIAVALGVGEISAEVDLAAVAREWVRSGERYRADFEHAANLVRGAAADVLEAPGTHGSIGGMLDAVVEHVTALRESREKYRADLEALKGSAVAIVGGEVELVPGDRAALDALSTIAALLPSANADDPADIANHAIGAIREGERWARRNAVLEEKAAISRELWR